MYLKSITSLILICFILITPLSTTKATSTQIEVDSLNVREEPTTESEVIDQVHTGDIYQVLQTLDDWVRIELTDKIGWVSMKYITLIPKEDESLSSTDGISTALLHHTTHMRSGPSTTNAITSYIEKGTKITVVPIDDDWYQVTHNGETGYILKKVVNFKQLSTTLENKTITIDAGHGGQDVGSISSSGIYEKDLTLYTSNKLMEKLTLLGAKVILTRTNDDYIRLASRVSLTNITNTDAFISIHYNSFPELPNTSGIGTYYHHEKDMLLADAIQKELIKATNANNRGAAFENYQVLRQNYKPAILVELGFISNYQNEQLLLSDPYQEMLVKGIINGLTSYFEN